MAIRMGEWKLVKTSEGPLQAATPETYTTLSGAGLYNLANDIGETNDLSGKEPARVRELTTAWQRWNKELAVPLWLPLGRRGGGGGQPASPSARRP